MMGDEITPEDEMKAENELLKLKLEMEHGMSNMDTKLSPDAENEWLNYIHNFEKVYKDAKQVKVIAFIGSPSYKRITELSSEEISAELDHLLDVMADGGVKVDFICEYEDDVKYKFITEELFESEIDDIKLQGAFQCFIYEEFHPNHDYDLRRHGEYFLERIFNKTWVEEYAKYDMTPQVIFHAQQYDARGISQIILTFQETVKRFEVTEKNISEVSFDMTKFTGHVKIAISYMVHWKDDSSIKYTGDCHLYFVSEYGGWSISSFSLPGLE